MKRHLVASIALTLLLGACAGDPPVYGSAVAVATRMGCDDLSTSSAQKVAEVGSCRLHGEQVRIFMFDDLAQRDEWLSFGGKFSEDLVTGTTWAVDPPPGMTAEVEEALL